jgi:hypothetical protein
MRILILDNFIGMIDLQRAQQLDVDKVILRGEAVMQLFHTIIPSQMLMSQKSYDEIRQRWVDTDHINCYSTKRLSDESPVPLLKPVLGFRFVHVTKAEVEAEQANQPVFGGGF